MGIAKDEVAHLRVHQATRTEYLIIAVALSCCVFFGRVGRFPLFYCVSYAKFTTAEKKSLNECLSAWPAAKKEDE